MGSLRGFWSKLCHIETRHLCTCRCKSGSSMKALHPRFLSTSPVAQEVIKSVLKPKKEIKQEQEEHDPSTVLLNIDLVNHLERTSLVDFDSEEALKRLEEAVQFANSLFEVDTRGVEPLTSILEDETLYLREDGVGVTKRDAILSNAVVTEEDYFVAPPGNIPLETSENRRNK